MKVAIYSRVSVGGVQTIENQVIELRRYVEARGWTIFKEYADDPWQSGALLSAPAPTLSRHRKSSDASSKEKLNARRARTSGGCSGTLKGEGTLRGAFPHILASPGAGGPFNVAGSIADVAGLPD